MTEPENIEQIKVRNADQTGETPVGGVTGTRSDDIDTEQSAGLDGPGINFAAGGPPGPGEAPVAD